MEQAHICRFERQMVVKAHIYCWKKNSSILTQVPHSLKELLLKSQPQKLLLQYQVKSNNVFVPESICQQTDQKQVLHQLTELVLRLTACGLCGFSFTAASLYELLVHVPKILPDLPADCGFTKLW